MEEGMEEDMADTTQVMVMAIAMAMARVGDSSEAARTSSSWPVLLSSEAFLSENSLVESITRNEVGVAPSSRTENTFQ